MNKLPLLTHPIGCPGCYSLDMYCDHDHSDDESNGYYALKSENFYAEYGSTARRMARQAGWVFHKDGTATCPECSGKSKGKRRSNR